MCSTRLITAFPVFFLDLGFAFSTLIKCHGCRVVAVLGSAIAAVGLLSSAFAPSVTFLYLSYGIVAGK